MTKKRDFKIEMLPGNKYKSLEEAQKAALPELANDLVDTIRRLLDTGHLVMDNGTVRPFRPGDTQLVAEYLATKNISHEPAKPKPIIKSRHPILQNLGWLEDDSLTYILIEEMLEVAERKKINVFRQVFYNEYNHISSVRWSIEKDKTQLYAQEFIGKEGKTSKWSGYPALSAMLAYVKAIE